jgi:hypothetical protein
MEVKYSVQLEDNRLEQYDKILSNFKNWKEYKREIKLNSLLESKRIEFEINISSHTFGVLYVELSPPHGDTEVRLNGVCAAITDMRFILNEDKVDLLEINMKFLTTICGKEASTLVDSGLDLILKQLIVNDSVIKFYLDIEDISERRDRKIKTILN